MRNAIESGAAQVSLRTRAEHGVLHRRRAHPLVVRVEIADDGRGVPEDLAERIFLPLVSGRAEGSGLGLALAQQVAREHGGSLGYRSRPGHTVFTLLLPVADDDAEEGAAMPTAARATRSARLGGRRRPQRCASCWPSAARGRLSRSTASTARAPRSTRCAAPTARPTWCSPTCACPASTAWRLLDRLKAAAPQLPVIVMSAYTDIASTAGAFRGGAHEFLSKPFDLDDAVALAARALPDAARDDRGGDADSADAGAADAGAASATRRRCANCSAASAGSRRRRCRC